MFEMLAIEDAEDTCNELRPLLVMRLPLRKRKLFWFLNASEGFLGSGHVVGYRTIVSHQQPSGATE
jgi:hypothetical protein